MLNLLRHTVVMAIILVPAASKIPLFIGGFFPMTSMYYNGWTGGNGIQPAADMALEHINTAGILRDYELKMIWNDTRGSPGWTENILYQFLSNPPRKIMLLGAGYSSCSTVVAALAGLNPWRIPQISYASTSPALSDKFLYPYFYRTIPDDTSFNAPRFAILKTFNWSHVGIIYQEEDIHRAAVAHLQLEIRRHGTRELTAEAFRDNAVTQMANLKKRDARIIFGNFFGHGARKVFCEAHKLGMYGPRYLWVIIGYIEKDWWLINDSSIECTADQLLAAANHHLSTDYLWQANEDMETVSGKTVKEFFQQYNNKVEKSKRDEHSSYVYDALWAMALGLNHTLTKMPGKRLDLLPYGDNETIAVLRKELDRVTFNGVTGPVAFTSKRNRVGDTRIMQFIDGKQIPVGLYENQLGVINWTGHDKIIWPGGSPPSDRIQQVYKLTSPSLILYGFMVSVSIICILVTLFFLWFNTRHKNIRYIKMSSPNLNNIIILGCVLNYVSVATFGLDGSLVDYSYHSICASRSWTLSLGFSLAYGAMFSKTWRVHTIFTNRKLRGKIVKDRHLLAIVFLLLMVDVTYLIIWQSIDPLRRIVYDAQVETSSDNHVEIVYQMEHCESGSTYLWLGMLFGYKGILLLFGAFLAWETRKVTITALNDSKYIGFSVYNVFILCAIGVPVSLALKDQPDASFSIISILIIFGTSLTICFVFIPKVTELRKQMQIGGGPEPIERTFTVGSVSRNNLDHGISTLNSNHRREIQEYKDKLEEKEEEIINLRKRLQAHEKTAEPSQKEGQNVYITNRLQAANNII